MNRDKNIDNINSSLSDKEINNTDEKILTTKTEFDNTDTYEEMDKDFSSYYDIEEEPLLTNNIKDEKLDTDEINETNDCEDVRSFYTEVIKQTKKMTGFKRAVVLVAVASVLGGTFIGFGISISSYILSDVTRGSFSESEEQMDFSFGDEDLTSNDIDTEEGKASDSASYGMTSPIKANEFVSFADIIEKVEPSVVCITSTSDRERDTQNLLTPLAGSGILFFESKSKYYIATNYHVVEGASRVSVSVSNSEPMEARVIGIDNYNDLAVVYINKKDVVNAGVKNVMLASFGDSDSMKVGDPVLAIGNALGDGNIATNGIVSAKEKSILIGGNLRLKVMQTNAAINKGNSGGPLVNSKGEVIGINTAKISENSAEGMGYSIPSNAAKPIIQGFMDAINKPYIGVILSEVPSYLSDDFDLPAVGAYVEEILPDSPSEKYGIFPGDIITGFDDEPILSTQQLIDAVERRNIGDQVLLKILRIMNGEIERVELQIKLEQRM